MNNAPTVAARDRIPAELQDVVDRALARALAEDWVPRLWRRDASLWTDDAHVAGLIGDRLGWLDVPEYFAERVEELEAFALAVLQEGFTGALVCGMGGSSLAPEVLAKSLPRTETGIPVRVLDSTDPTAVRAASTALDPASTLYLVASKSGTTTETLAFLSHFWQLADDIHADIPQGLAGAHFAAITDPDKSLDAIPHNDLFRTAFLNPSNVGGRSSALTYVGLVPAALLGLDLRSLLEEATQMAARCRIEEPINPGLWLGVTLGALASAGRDKLTLVIEPRIASLGSWIEQLVAESTGKRGVGIVPVVDDPLGDPSVYGHDRVFVRLSSGTHTAWEERATADLAVLAAAGHPVLELEYRDGAGGLGAEFFRWEFATAISGVVLGINPFDEPNVTESKENTRRVIDEYRDTGSLPAREATVESSPLRLFGDAPLRLTAGDGDAAAELRRHVSRAKPGGYVALHAYICSTPERDAALAGLAQLIRDRTGRAVTVGYGPRFLHSTGQLHKGGPPIGCFIQLTAEYDAADDLPIPGWRESFGTLIHAQAAGDFISLESHELPVLSIDLSTDPDSGLAALRATLDRALPEPTVERQAETTWNS